MKRFFCALILLTTLTLPARASEPPFTVEAKAAVLIDGASGRVLFAQNANEPLPMASTTKIMTAIIALEHSLPGEIVTAGKNASGVEGSSIYLSAGEELSMEHLLYGLMLRSGNDAAVAIAEHIAGSVDAFAQMMNDKAKELGANARFVNPHGLPAEGHKASALGMALIMRSALTIPDFRTITSTTRKVIPWVGNEYSRVLENKNKLLTTYEGATGGKTGYTKAAGRCLVFSAKRNGMELIGTVLGCPTWFDTAAALLDYGFENFQSKTVLSAGQIAGTASILGGESRTVEVISGGELAAAIAANRQFTVHYEYNDLTAPVRKGDIIGTAYMKSDGEILARCPLLAARDVGKWNFAAALRSVLRNWLIGR